MLIYNDDGWSSYMRYPAPMSREDVVAVTVGAVAGTGVDVYQYCSLGGHAVNYNSAFLPRVGEMMEAVDTMHVWRMRETLRHLESLGTDPLEIVTEACHDAGIKCQWSLRMNDQHHAYKRRDGSYHFPELLSEWLTEHPELLLDDGPMDYAKDGVAEYRKQQVAEVLEKYAVDGIDLDFTRFRPWFRNGQEQANKGKMTELVRELREMTRAAGKTLSARFEYDEAVCIASGLEVDVWLAEGLLDQVTLGGIGDHTPDARADWWIERAHVTGCVVCPSIEGQLHWCPGSGGGGGGTRASRDGVKDGYGPPSMEYMRGAAANYYASGADGMSMFNFTCADGPWARAALTELASADALEFKDKQYVGTMWEQGDQIYYMDRWVSRFRLSAGSRECSYVMRVGDDLAKARRLGREPGAVLTLDLQNVNRMDDFRFSINGTELTWNAYDYNHYDDGCWNDVVEFEVPSGVLKQGENMISIGRERVNEGFAGDVQVRKCILELKYNDTFTPGSVANRDG